MSFDLRKECEGAARIGITGHIRPDGDCVSAALATQMYLKKCLPEATVQVFLESPQEIFRDLKGFDEIITDFPALEPFDVFLVLDCGKDRTGGAEKYFDAAKKTINIDHHVSNTGTGDLIHICPQIGSVCEVLYGLFDKTMLDADIAKAIYTGMIHDTGVFQYSNTTPTTMRIGADLLEYGFDAPNLILDTFYRKTYVQMQILGRALLESIRFLDNRCIVSMIDKKTMDFYGATSKDMDGIINQLRNIRGIHCAIFLYQIDVLEYKVSLRSDELVDVSVVAQYFGGGGHKRAAGCIMRGTFHDCVNNLAVHIEKQLDGV